VRKVLKKNARCVGHCIASLRGAQRAPKGAKAASKVHTRPQTSPGRAHCLEAILRQMTPTAAEIVQNLLTDASVLATTAACQVWQRACQPLGRRNSDSAKGADDQSFDDGVLPGAVSSCAGEGLGSEAWRLTAVDGARPKSDGSERSYRMQAVEGRQHQKSCR